MSAREIIIIGGGPAGVAAALEAAAAGAAVRLVHAEPIGGRAAWSSLIPSKVYLTAADRLALAEHQAVLGLDGDAPKPSLAVLRARIGEQAQAWSDHLTKQLAAAGVICIDATARLTTPTRVAVNAANSEAAVVEFDAAIIAAGSLPIFRPDIKPDGRRILAPRHAGTLAEWPQHLIMIGGGVTGAEFVSFFRSMGCRTTWITDQPTMLPRVDSDLAAALERSLAARDVVLERSAAVAAVAAADDAVRVVLADGRVIAGSHAFIAIGRRPDVAELGLDAAGIAHGTSGIVVDDYCRTSCRGIYAVGDVVGPPFVANRAVVQARIAARDALGLPTAPFRPETVVEATYTAPQVATIGMSERAATASGTPIVVRRAVYSDALKARLTEADDGFVKIIAHKDDGRLLGAGAFGDHAADVLAPLAPAIAGGLAVDDLAAIAPAYPTISELVFIAARGYSC